MEDHMSHDTHGVASGGTAVYFVSNREFRAEYGGELVTIRKGERLIEGHALLCGREDYFERDSSPRCAESSRPVASMNAAVQAPGFPASAPSIAAVMAALVKT